MTLNTTTDQTPEEILNAFIGTFDGGKDEAPLIRLDQFVADVSPYVRGQILDNFSAAVAGGKIDAVTLAGADVSLEIENVSGEVQTITMQDELIRDNAQAQAWRGEIVKKATKANMLRTGKIEAPLSELQDTARFDELLTLRRKFARRQAKVKHSPTELVTSQSLQGKRQLKSTK